MKIGIIDYGSGNFSSVFNAFNILTSEIKQITVAKEFDECSHLVLPGVGTFSKAIEKLSKLHLLEKLNSQIIKVKKPFLGICVGMQILAEKGFEFQESKGLGFISGTVKEFKFDTGNELLLPHIGWNSIENLENNDLFMGIDSSDSDFYFVHSFHLISNEKNASFCYTEYGYKFISAVQKENIFGVQFHPEKSQSNGLKLLSNFIKINA